MLPGHGKGDSLWRERSWPFYSGWIWSGPGHSFSRSIGENAVVLGTAREARMGMVGGGKLSVVSFWYLPQMVGRN